MSRFFYLTVMALFIAGCGSSSNVATNVNVKTVEVNTVANRTIASAVNQPDSNAEIQTNANKIVIQNTMVSKENARLWERKKGGSKETTPIADKVGKIAIAAPDNSEVTSQMNEKGQPLETRVFKNHQILSKVERIDLDNRNIKAYLKNGKVVNLPEGKIENFLTAPANDILEAIGVK